jgi:hypothetical protein
VVIPSEIRLNEDSRQVCQRHLWEGSRNECNLNNLIPQNTNPRMLIYDKQTKSGSRKSPLCQMLLTATTKDIYVVSAIDAVRYVHAQIATIWSSLLSTGITSIPESVCRRRLPLIRCLGPCFAHFSRTNRPSVRTSSDAKSKVCRQKQLPPLRAGNIQLAYRSQQRPDKFESAEKARTEAGLHMTSRGALASEVINRTDCIRPCGAART